jgi:O-antigen ligase
VIYPAENTSAARTWLAANLMALCIAAMLCGSFIGLVHDPNYATARGAELVEDGRGIEDKTVMEGGLNAAQAGRAMGLVLLIGVGAVCLLTTPRGARFRWDGLTVLVAFCLLWASASVLWSTERGTTIRELVRLYIYVGVAAALARRFDPKTLCFVLAAALGGSVLTATLFEIATGGFRPWLADYRLTGTLHCNVLAAQASFVAVVAYAFAVRGEKWKRILVMVFVAAVALVFFTKARTALFTVAGGVAAVHIIGRPMRNWLLLGAGVATVAATSVLIATTVGLLDGHQAKHVATLGRTDDTSALTGRVPLWNYVWQKLDGRKLQGFGWGAFWLVERTLDAHDELGWYPRHSHNAYLHTVVNVGLIGLAMVLAIGILSLARTTRLIGQTGLPEYSALAAIIVSIFVNAVAESAYAMPRDMMLFATAIAFSLAVHHSPVSEFARIRTSTARGRSFANSAT